jgi:hypothetical protein
MLWHVKSMHFFILNNNFDFANGIDKWQLKKKKLFANIYF